MPAVRAMRRSSASSLPSRLLQFPTATRTGDSTLVNVLDELERVLVEIAHSPAQLSSAQLNEIQQRIEARGILFKVRVIGSQVREREKSAGQIAPRGRS